MQSAAVRFVVGVLALSSLLVLASCDGNGETEPEVLTIGRDGEVVPVDEVDELAPFNPETQQLIFHLTLDQAREFTRRFPSAMILDIRPPDQYREGHIPNARNVDWLADQELFQLFVGQLAREERYLVYASAAMGADTGAAVALMRGIGFQNIYIVPESFDAWQSKGLPFEQGPDRDPLPLPPPPDITEAEAEAGDDPELVALWAIWHRAEAFVKERDAALAKEGGDPEAEGESEPAIDAEGDADLETDSNPPALPED